MKSHLLFSLLAVANLACAQNAIFDNKTWYSDKNALQTQKHDPIKAWGSVYEYSLTYQTSAGKGYSELCRLESPVLLSCLSGEQVTYHPKDFSVTLNIKASGESYTYQDKDHPFDGNSIAGYWHRAKEISGNCKQARNWAFNIPAQPAGAKKFTNVRITYAHDSGYSEMNTFYLMQDDEKRFFLSYEGYKDASHIIYLHDKCNHFITEERQLSKVVKLNDGEAEMDPACDFIKD